MAISPSRSYRNTAPGVLAAESEAARARRNGISPAPVRDPGDIDSPLSAPREWHNEMNDNPPAPAAGPDLTPLQPPEQLKGAVKVSEFPERSKYPFRQIADDGGIWEIDPAVYKVTPGAIVQAARKWADGRSLPAKVITDDGLVYIQFKAGA